MAEYIEREAAIEAVEAQCVDGKMYGRDDGEGTLVDAYDIIDAISDAPAADVVEVVRCGQCFYSAHEGELWICVHPDQYCDCVAKIVNPGYFCGYGRRIGVVDDNSDT